MWLGRQQLGTWIDVYLQVTSTAFTPTMPDYVPTIKVRRSDGTVVYSGLMPIVDKTDDRLGLFASRVFLGSGMSAGAHTIEMNYKAGTKFGVESRTFDIIAGGHSRGQVLAMHYLHQPQADFVVYQVESGLILRGKNPRVS